MRGSRASRFAHDAARSRARFVPDERAVGGLPSPGFELATCEPRSVKWARSTSERCSGAKMGFEGFAGGFQV